MERYKAYNEICKVMNEVRDIRKRYTTFATEPEFIGMVAHLISCEEAVEAEARKYC